MNIRTLAMGYMPIGAIPVLCQSSGEKPFAELHTTYCF